jgi:hypothetical protein
MSKLSLEELAERVEENLPITAAQFARIAAALRANAELEAEHRGCLIMGQCLDEANAKIADLEEAVSALLAFMKNPSVDTCLRMNSALFHAEVTW